MNIFDWLKSKSELKLSDDTSYETIILERGYSKESEWSSVEFHDRELMRADLYVLLFTFPSQVTRSLGSQGFNQSESYQNSYRDKYLDIALGIYRTYDKNKYKELGNQRSNISGFKMKQGW